MKVTSVLGHMMEMEFREPFNKWSACKAEELFDAPLVKSVSKMRGSDASCENQ